MFTLFDDNSRRLLSGRSALGSRWRARAFRFRFVAPITMRRTIEFCSCQKSHSVTLYVQKSKAWYVVPCVKGYCETRESSTSRRENSAGYIDRTLGQTSSLNALRLHAACRNWRYHGRSSWLQIRLKQRTSRLEPILIMRNCNAKQLI